MRFRVLTDEELSHFEEDLKGFLIINGVHHEEWLAMNQNAPEKALALVELFSDIVLEKVYTKIHYLEHRSKDSLLVFYVQDQSMEMVSFFKKQEGLVDFSATESIHQSFLNAADQIGFKKQILAFDGPRIDEVFKLIEKGCIPSTASFWQSINQII